MQQFGFKTRRKRLKLVDVTPFSGYPSFSDPEVNNREVEIGEVVLRIVLLKLNVLRIVLSFEQSFIGLLIWI